jgi:hypothetical protein
LLAVETDISRNVLCAEKKGNGFKKAADGTRKVRLCSSVVHARGTLLNVYSHDVSYFFLGLCSFVSSTTRRSFHNIKQQNAGTYMMIAP